MGIVEEANRGSNRECMGVGNVHMSGEEEMIVECSGVGNTGTVR